MATTNITPAENLGALADTAERKQRRLRGGVRVKAHFRRVPFSSSDMSVRTSCPHQLNGLSSLPRDDQVTLRSAFLERPKPDAGCSSGSGHDGQKRDGIFRNQ